MPRRMPLTIAIAVVCVLVFALMAADARGYNLLMGSGRRLPALISAGAVIPTAIDAGQYWRLITAGFLHFSLIHLGMNMLALIFVGAYCEPRYGTWRFGLIYLGALLGGDVLAAATSDNRSASAGASGAVMGAFGAMAWTGLRFRSERHGFTGALGTIIATIIYGLVQPGISNAAHIGGLVVGFLAARAIGPSPRWIADVTRQEDEAMRAALAEAETLDRDGDPPASIVADPTNQLVIEPHGGTTTRRYVNALPLLLIAIIVLGIAIVRSYEGGRVEWVWVLGGVTLLALTVYSVLPGRQSRLALDPHGLTLTSFTGTRRLRWRDVEAFGLRRVSGGYGTTTQVAGRLRAAYLARQPAGVASIWHSDVIAFPSDLGMPPEDLAALLEHWRQRWTSWRTNVHSVVSDSAS